MNILDEGIEMVGKILSTVLVGGFTIWVIKLASYFPRDIGEPIAQVIVFVLLCVWYLLFINTEMWESKVYPTCLGCDPDLDDPDMYFCEVCNLMPNTPIVWAHRQTGESNE